MYFGGKQDYMSGIFFILVLNKYKKMVYLAYIIGEIPERITLKCQQKFGNAQLLLESMGFRVINPIKNLVSQKIKFQDANIINIRKLINCNAVYVLSSVSFENVKNAELLLAIKLNMLIIQDSIYLNEEDISSEFNVLQDSN